MRAFGRLDRTVLAVVCAAALAASCTTTSNDASSSDGAPAQTARLHSRPAAPSDLLPSFEARPLPDVPPPEQPRRRFVPESAVRQGESLDFGPPGALLTRAPTARTAPEWDAPAGGEGFVTCSAKAYSIRLQEDVRSRVGVRLRSGRSRHAVPAGTYKAATCTFDRTDANGVRWRIEGYGTLEPAVTVTAGATRELVVGPPLTATMTVTPRRDGSFSLTMVVRDRAGLRYSPASISRAGRRITAPRFEVRDEKGNVVHTGRFEYG